MQKLERYLNLVHPQWLNDLMTNNNPEGYYGDNYVICHAHYRNRADYEKGHIPGAIPLDTLVLESPETWNRREPEELEEALCKLGITNNSTVILYGRFSFPDNNDPFPGSSAGQLGAIRCAAIMLYAGVRDVKILNGGIQSWKEAGIIPEKQLAFYCGIGWRESEAFFNAWLMGWPKVSVFDGGWFEWSNNPENPITTGIPE